LTRIGSISNILISNCKLAIEFDRASSSNSLQLLLLLLAMERPIRKKRAPHREPTSIAIKAIATASNTSQIDPALLDIDLPPQSSPSALSKDAFHDPFGPGSIQSPPIESDADLISGFEPIDNRAL
jgi:hypothetical protein